MSYQQEFNGKIVEYLKGSPTNTKQIAGDFGLERGRAGKLLTRAFVSGVIGRYVEASSGAWKKVIWTERDGGKETTLETLRALPRDPFAHMVARLA